LMRKKMMSMLLTLLFICLAYFGLPWTEHAIQTPVYGSCFLPQHFLIFARVSVALFPKFDAVPWSYPLQNCIRPVTRHEIEGRKKISTFTQLREIL
jgi:hypothetical protein